MAQHRSHVPKFGNWESEDNVPYTVYFDKARAGRGAGGKMINPNYPEGNSDILSSSESTMPPSRPPPPTPPRAQPDSDGPRGPRPVRPVHERKLSNEIDFGAANGSRNHQGPGARGAGPGPGDPYQKRAGRGGSATPEHSVERSPIHHQARMTGRGIGSGSPSWEGRAARENSHGTPGRSRLSASRGDEQIDKGSTVPKFGEWDENDPASADGYTHIFNKVREERQTGPRNGPGYTESPYRPSAGRNATSSGSKICCFPWGRS